MEKSSISSGIPGGRGRGRYNSLQGPATFVVRLAVAQQLGAIQEEIRSGGSRWFISIWVPETDPTTGKQVKKRRKLYSGPDVLGVRRKFADRQAAEFALMFIRSSVAQGRPLEQVIDLFMPNQRHNRVHARWRDYVRDRAARRERDPIGDRRLYDLGRMVERGYLDFFADLYIEDLANALLEDWQNWMGQRWPLFFGKGRAPEPTDAQRAAGIRGFHKPKTRCNIVHDFLTFDRWLVSRDLRDRPLATPTLPEVDPTAPEVPSEDVLERYIALIPEDRRGIFLARSYDGLRPSEARRVTVGDYDFRSRVLFIERKHTKTPAGVRAIEVDDELGDWLERWVPLTERFNADRPLFINPNQFRPNVLASKRASARLRGEPEPITTGAWEEDAETSVHKKACRKLGIYYPPNVMGRHSAATHALRRTRERFGTYDIEAVRRMLGHREARTTLRYVDANVIDNASTRRIRSVPPPPSTGTRRGE